MSGMSTQVIYVELLDRCCSWRLLLDMRIIQYLEAVVEVERYVPQLASSFKACTYLLVGSG